MQTMFCYLCPLRILEECIRCRYPRAQLAFIPQLKPKRSHDEKAFAEVTRQIERRDHLPIDTNFGVKKFIDDKQSTSVYIECVKNNLDSDSKEDSKFIVNLR